MYRFNHHAATLNRCLTFKRNCLRNSAVRWLIQSVRGGGFYNSKHTSQTVYFDFLNCILNTFLAFFFPLSLQSQLLCFRRIIMMITFCPEAVRARLHIRQAECKMISELIQSLKGNVIFVILTPVWDCCVTLSFYTHHSQLYTGRQHGEINSAIWGAARMLHRDGEREREREAALGYFIHSLCGKMSTAL